jgi:hypothetical protein
MKFWAALLLILQEAGQEPGIRVDAGAVGGPGAVAHQPNGG